MKFALRLFTALVISAPCFALPSGLDSAVAASAEGRWDTALTLWQAASDKYPNDPDVSAELGVAEMNTGQLKSARRNLNRAQRLSSTNLRALMGLSRLAVTENRYDEAVTIALKAATLHPDSGDAYRCLGEAQKAASRRSDAEATFRRAVILNPEDWKNHAALADAILMRNKTDEAVKHYREAVRLNPADSGLRESLGRAAMAGARYGEAARAYVDAMDMERKGKSNWSRMDTLTLSAIDALGRAAVALRDGQETREDVYEANKRSVEVTDALLEIPAVADATPRTDLAMSYRAAAYGLLGQSSASELAALRKTSGSDAADAAVFREQARRGVVTARAESTKPKQ